MLPGDASDCPDPAILTPRVREGRTTLTAHLPALRRNRPGAAPGSCGARLEWRADVTISISTHIIHMHFIDLDAMKFTPFNRLPICPV
ncbi:hypothetical protein GCM10018966_091190 [Streptomyces yanii]